jgi:hypothetical protein
MTQRIEDYAVIGDLHTAAMVGRNGSIDWLCLPHFDSPSCFSQLLGDESHGFWQLAPAGGEEAIVATRRSYRKDSLVLETEFDTATGTVRITDCMPMRDSHPHVVRLVEGLAGTVDMHMDLTVRFDYGEIVPWLTSTDGLIRMTAGPRRRGAVAPGRSRRPRHAHRGRLHRARGAALPLHLRLVPLARGAPAAARRLLRHQPDGRLLEGVGGPLHLRGPVPRRGGALAHHAEGADLRAHRRHRGRRHDLAARGARRQPQLGLPLLLAARRHPHPGVAHARGLLRRGDGLARLAAARRGRRRLALQIMYGPAGERRLDEWEASWLPGYEASAPVRIGNAASGQFQLDVYGEVMSALYASAHSDGVQSKAAWACRPSWSTSSRPAGASPTTGSGRCAARAGTSRTPR